MKITNIEWFLYAGVVIGAVLWGSLTSLLENNGVLSIFGLAVSCLSLGVVMGICIGIGVGVKHD